MNNLISESRDDHKYFCQIPNMVDDIGLSVYAFRLYVHLKRVAGEEGECWQSTKTLADNCRMSIGAVVNAKKELIEQRLIDVESMEKAGGGRPYHLIRIADIWPKNMARYADDSPDKQVTVGNLQVHHVSNEVHGVNLQVHHTERKNNPLKKREGKKIEKGTSSVPPSPPSEKPSDGGIRAAAAALRSHPAIQAIKEVTNYFPPPELYQLIIEKIGETPDKAKLWRVHMFMKLKGHNPRNYSNLLDRYETGLQYVTGDDRARLDAMQNPYEVGP